MFYKCFPQYFCVKIVYTDNNNIYIVILYIIDINKSIISFLSRQLLGFRGTEQIKFK